MTPTELDTFYASLASDNTPCLPEPAASDNTPCLPEPAASLVDDWHESGNLE